MIEKVALVTGAGSGIGRAVAQGLSRAGYQVAAVGRRAGALEETAASGIPGTISPMPADIADPASIGALFDQVATRFGRLDLLFNNAGVSAPAVPIDELPLEAWRQVVDTNLTGAFLCTQAAFRIMRAQTPRGGRIINNGSISAHAPRPLSIAYTATKHGVTGLTRSTALDGRAYDIACGQIDIGNAATDMTQRMAKGVLQADGQARVEPTFDVAEVARTVVHMASLPPSTNALFITLMATQMPFVGRG